MGLLYGKFLKENRINGLFCKFHDENIKKIKKKLRIEKLKEFSRI